MHVKHFAITRTDATVTASHEYVAELDKTIDELRGQLELLQGLRRAVAGTFSIDRAEGATGFGLITENLKRAEYEGDDAEGPDGRLVPRGMPKASMEAVG